MFRKAFAVTWGIFAAFGSLFLIIAGLFIAGIALAAVMFTHTNQPSDSKPVAKPTPCVWQYAYKDINSNAKEWVCA